MEGHVVTTSGMYTERPQKQADPGNEKKAHA